MGVPRPRFKRGGLCSGHTRASHHPLPGVIGPVHCLRRRNPKSHQYRSRNFWMTSKHLKPFAYCVRWIRRFLVVAMAACALGIGFLWVNSYDAANLFLLEHLVERGSQQYGRTWEFSCLRGSLAFGRRLKRLSPREAQQWKQDSGFHKPISFGPRSYLSFRDPHTQSIWNAFGFGIVNSDYQ